MTGTGGSEATGADAQALALFEDERPRLRAAAFRMLGSFDAAEDAVQEAWLRFDRDGRAGRDGLARLENPAAWLLTVVGRICLDMLRARRARPESPVAPELLDPLHGPAEAADPAQEAVLAESVGRAMLVVLERLAPAERIAFVLHDLFAVPFEQIAPVVGRTPQTAKKLASRARQRVRGTQDGPPVDAAWHRRVVEAFLAAARGRDIAGLLAVLDPDVVRHADPAVAPAGAPLELRGAEKVVEETLLFWRNAQRAELALVDGRVGLIVAPAGRLRVVISITVEGGLITEYSVSADPERLARTEIAALD